MTGATLHVVKNGYPGDLAEDDMRAVTLPPSRSTSGTSRPTRYRGRKVVIYRAPTGQHSQMFA
jgi:hypothetical protein